MIAMRKQVLACKVQQRPMRKARLQGGRMPSNGGNFTSFQPAKSANSANRSKKLCRFGMIISRNDGMPIDAVCSRAVLQCRLCAAMSKNQFFKGLS